MRKLAKWFQHSLDCKNALPQRKKTATKLENDIEKTNGQIVKIKSDVGKTSNDLNAFKTEMDKHLTKTNFENRINKLELEFQKLSSDVKHTLIALTSDGVLKIGQIRRSVSC